MLFIILQLFSSYNRLRPDIQESAPFSFWHGAPIRGIRVPYLYDLNSIPHQLASSSEQQLEPGVEFRFGLRESKLILMFQLLHISMEKLILISECYENHCENRFSDSCRISSPELLSSMELYSTFSLLKKLQQQQQNIQTSCMIIFTFLFFFFF